MINPNHVHQLKITRVYPRNVGFCGKPMYQCSGACFLLQLLIYHRIRKSAKMSRIHHIFTKVYYYGDFYHAMIMVIIWLAIINHWFETNILFFQSAMLSLLI